MNSFFKKSVNRRWTWRSPNSNTKNEIDYVLTNKKFTVRDVSAPNRFDTGSDHRFVRAKIEINMKRELNKLIKIQPFSISKKFRKTFKNSKLNSTRNYQTKKH